MDRRSRHHAHYICTSIPHWWFVVEGRSLREQYFFKWNSASYCISLTLKCNCYERWQGFIAGCQSPLGLGRQNDVAASVPSVNKYPFVHWKSMVVPLGTCEPALAFAMDWPLTSEITNSLSTDAGGTVHDATLSRNDILELNCRRTIFLDNTTRKILYFMWSLHLRTIFAYEKIPAA